MPLITDSIGRVLGKRYRLVSALGTGASAHVYLAEDVSLRRYVAVKVLQPVLANDSAFLKRFRAEARSVASLNHPHVLRVFDWGEEDDTPYLVLEYLSGGTLRDLLDKGVHLSHAQAAKIGEQVAQGLAYAHARGLVHRDIKPANILFDEEGLVRVADFGVARAVAEAAWTEPVGAMVGTARYAAPEAVEGKQVDGRADVYSLALVLYETVTGVVPFVTDTTVGTLMARVGASLPHDERLGPLDDVLARAASPDPTGRLDASGLAARLAALSSALPIPEPLALQIHKPDERGDLRAIELSAQDDLTQIISTTPSVDIISTQSLSPLAKRTTDDRTDLTKSDSEEPTLALALEAEPAQDQTPPTSAKHTRTTPTIAHRTERRRYWPWVLSACLLIVLVLAGAYIGIRNKVFTPSYAVPHLSGLTVAQARRLATGQNHFNLKIAKSVLSTTVASGTVISQRPRAGILEKKGTVITVVPSAGPPPVTVPSLTGMNCSGAQAALSNVHLKGVCTAPVYNDAVVSGGVISWSYGSTQQPTTALYGGTISIAISKGHAPVDIPSIASSDTYAQAKAALSALGLLTTEVTQTSTTVPNGGIIGTNPGPGQPAPYGSTITVTVSTGPPTTTVPNLIGDSVAVATATLSKDGLSVAGAYGPNAQSPQATIIQTNPPAGATEVVGTAIDLYTN